MKAIFGNFVSPSTMAGIRSALAGDPLRIRWCGDHTGAQCVKHQARASWDSQFPIHTADVISNRRVTDSRLLGDVFGGQTLRQPTEDLALSDAESIASARALTN